MVNFQLYIGFNKIINLNIYVMKIRTYHLKLGFTLICYFLCFSVFAENGSPGPDEFEIEPPPQAPIDDYIGYMLVMALFTAYLFLSKYNKLKSKFD